ncbi:hypothetical protein H8356DRAFT_1310770 [Neocallimastix lanati (nom. inval.)]|nr:hypothetical protein H8356DRAFT_1310770 [Neocallimastix sp. JGI-2020a]
MPKQTGSKSYTDIELCLIFKEILYLLPYKKSEWENIYAPCKMAVEMYNKTHKDQLIIRKAKAIARKFEDMTYSSKKIVTNVADNESPIQNSNTHIQLCHIATQIKALCKINFLFKEGQKNYKLNKIIIKRRRRILQSISEIERYYYDKKYNEDNDNSSLSSDNETKSINSFPSTRTSVDGNVTPTGFNKINIKTENNNEEQKSDDIEKSLFNRDDDNQKIEDIKYLQSVMKNIKDNIIEININDDYNKIIEQSLTTMKTISNILNDAILFCNMTSKRIQNYHNKLEEDDFSDDISVFSDDDTLNSKLSIDKSLNDALRIINEDESKTTEKNCYNEYINNIENNYSLSNIDNTNTKQNKKRKKK